MVDDGQRWRLLYDVCPRLLHRMFQALACVNEFGCFFFLRSFGCCFSTRVVRCHVSLAFSPKQNPRLCIAVLCPRNWSMVVCFSLLFSDLAIKTESDDEKNGKCSRGHALWFSFNINMYDGQRLFGVFAASLCEWCWFLWAGRHHSCRRVIVSQRRKACNLVIIIGLVAGAFACMCGTLNGV